MSYYFHILQGLRGCYMPDSIYVVKVDTRRELRAAIAEEARHMGESAVGLSQRNISAFAARCWRDRNSRSWTLDYALPYAQRRGDSPAFGIFVSHATREEYLAQEEQF